MLRRRRPPLPPRAAAGASASAAAEQEEGGAAADDAAAPPPRAPKTNWTLGKGVHGRRPASAHGTRRSGGSSREVARGASWTRGLAGGSPPRAAATQHSGAIALSPGSYGAVASGASVAAAAAQLPEWTLSPAARERAAAVAKVQSAWRRTAKGGDDVANAGAADVSLTVSAAYMDGGGAAASPSPERRAARLAGGASRGGVVARGRPMASEYMQELSRPVSLGARPASARATTCSSRDPASRAAALKRAQAAAARFGDESDLPLPGEWWRRLNKTQPMRGVALEEELRRQTRAALGVDGHAFGKGDADEGVGRDDALLLGGVGGAMPSHHSLPSDGNWVRLSAAQQAPSIGAAPAARAATAAARARRAPGCGTLPRTGTFGSEPRMSSSQRWTHQTDLPFTKKSGGGGAADDDDADGGGGGGDAPPPNSFLPLDLRSAAKPRGVHEAKGGAVVAKAPR